MLEALTCEALGVSEVTDEAMKQLEVIRVVDSDRLLFVFKDGHTEERQWSWESRASSWTPKMKQKASEQMKQEQVKRRQRHE